MSTPEGILLASQSPRRRELIKLLGLPVQAAAANVDETPLPNEAPADYVRRLAATKAQALTHVLSGGRSEAPDEMGKLRWIVAADTAVVDRGEILGKPADEAEAEAMLRRLRGREHAVLTGVAVLDTLTGRMETTVERTAVFMRAFTDDEIAAYVASGDPLDKAGAYAIQNRAFAPVERIEGCYANVVGLPLCTLACMLRTLGASPAEDVPARCVAALGYNCAGNLSACVPSEQQDL
ncbi:MAG: septum formation protein Maf [Chloroflexi bacterium]|nr:septum formation protein Maf [Chloroflexota bacterium]